MQTPLTARDGTIMSISRLSDVGAEGLMRFNAGLSERTRGVFLPHAYDRATVARYVERDRLGLDRAYVLEAGDSIAGYFFLWEFDQPVPILGIGLADKWQGQGLGAPMVQRLIADAREASREAIELTTVPGNDRAIRLYLAAGFTAVGEVENVAGDGRVVREVRMFLALKSGVRPAERTFQPPV